MKLFVFFLVLAVIALALFGISFLISDRDGRTWTRGISGGLAILGCLLLFFASWTSVGTKNLGVPTAFGHPEGSYGNGFHWKKPWVKVKQLTNAVQTDTYASDGFTAPAQGGAAGTCVHVRIARQATGCVNVSIRWQIKGGKDGVDYLIRNFKNNDAITDNLVLRSLQRAMNQSFNNYDPLGIDVRGNSTNEPLSWPGDAKKNLSSDVLVAMRDEIGQHVDVQSVIIPLLNFDNATQDRINQLQQQVAQTRIAEQSKLTATAQALANKALAASVNNSPGVLVAQCLNMLQDTVHRGKDLPDGFSCFPGSGAAGIAIGVGGK